MAAMSERADVTNEEVAKDLEISHSMVSRVRSGDRTPSLALLITIARVMNWSVDDQAYAISHGNYAEKFEERLTLHYRGIQPGSWAAIGNSLRDHSDPAAP